MSKKHVTPVQRVAIVLTHVSTIKSPISDPAISGWPVDVTSWAVIDLSA